MANMTQILEKCFPTRSNGGPAAADSHDTFPLPTRNYIHTYIHSQTSNLLYTLLNALWSRGHQFATNLTAVSTLTTITGDGENTTTITTTTTNSNI